jgi:hypothetical protein
VGASIEDYRWLLSGAGERWLAAAGEEMAAGGQLSVSAMARLRKDLSAEQAHLVVEQIELRKRAQEKFSLAERMFFTRKGLEQATDEQIAKYKAARFPPGQLIMDLCCGIGGDLIALAMGRDCLGADRDEVCVLLAQRNCEVYRGSAKVFQEMAEQAVARVGSSQAWHIDPDRRPANRRTTRAEFFEPSLALLEQMLKVNPKGAIKLAPATEAPANWREVVELEWIGSRGECRQQVAWFGNLARSPGQQAATIVDAPGAPRTVIGQADERVPIAPQLGRYLYEPHAAVLAAKLTATLCREHGLEAVAAGVAYLTGDKLVDDPALDGFEILDVLPLERKQLKSYCREHAIGRLEVKKRGVEIEPEQLRREVIGVGDEERTLLVSRVGEQVRVMVARRVAASGVPSTEY